MYNDIIDTAIVENLTVNVYSDNDNDNINNPLTSECYLFGTVSCFHREYNLSSENSEFTDQDDLKRHIRLKNVISLPVYLYDHSGITINTTGFSCRWDSGEIGYIHITKEEIYKEFNVKRISSELLKKVYANLKGTISFINDYLTGNIHYFEIIDTDSEEILEAVYGYVGNSDICLNEGISEAKSILSFNTRERDKEAKNISECNAIMSY